MVTRRRPRTLQQVIDEWERDSGQLLPTLRGGAAPEGVPPFAGAVLVTDLAAHTRSPRAPPDPSLDTPDNKAGAVQGHRPWQCYAHGRHGSGTGGGDVSCHDRR